MTRASLRSSHVEREGKHSIVGLQLMEHETNAHAMRAHARQNSGGLFSASSLFAIVAGTAAGVALSAIFFMPQWREAATSVVSEAMTDSPNDHPAIDRGVDTSTITPVATEQKSSE